MQTFNIKTRNPGLLPEASYRGFRPQRSMNSEKITTAQGRSDFAKGEPSYCYDTLFGTRPHGETVGV